VIRRDRRDRFGNEAKAVRQEADPEKERCKTPAVTEEELEVNVVDIFVGRISLPEIATLLQYCDRRLYVITMTTLSASTSLAPG
jgi:hypothetical protein